MVGIPCFVFGKRSSVQSRTTDRFSWLKSFRVFLVRPSSCCDRTSNKSKKIYFHVNYRIIRRNIIWDPGSVVTARINMKRFPNTFTISLGKFYFIFFVWVTLPKGDRYRTQISALIQTTVYEGLKEIKQICHIRRNINSNEQLHMSKAKNGMYALMTIIFPRLRMINSYKHPTVLLK